MKDEKPQKKKGFISRILEKLDKKIEQKAQKSPCCCANKDNNNKPCS